MHLAEQSHRFGEHRNAFGFLRLLFASLVIVSHTPEMVDGDQHRELLARLTHTVSFGGIAVSGFFIISGFLITGSFLNSQSYGSYLTKRVARIYPAFIGASLFSLLVAAPLAGANLDQGFTRAAAKAVANIVILARPAIVGAFPGQEYHDPETALNGAMWTIQYEFACYILVVLLGVFRVLQRPAMLVLFAAALLISAKLMPVNVVTPFNRPHLFPGQLSALPNLMGMFVVGSLFYLLQERVPLTWLGAAAAAVGLSVTMLVPVLNQAGMALFGSYLIFAAAKAGYSTWLGEINNRDDISYGLYLYAWPIEQLLIRYLGTGSLVLLCGLTWLLAAACGWLSWALIEKPTMQWARRWKRRGMTAQEGSSLESISPGNR